MLVAVLDTSTTEAIAAVVRVTPPSQVRLLALERAEGARSQGELLAPALVAALAAVKVRPPDLAAVVAGLGPGPFTGLRVGLVTAAVLGEALGIPSYGVCSLDGWGRVSSGSVLVATDARRKEVYWAAYRDGERLAGPAVDRPADVPAELARLGIAPAAAVGAGARVYAGLLGLPVLDHPDGPSPLALVGLATERIVAHAPSETLTPLYLRRPDAVEPGRPKAVRS